MKARVRQSWMAGHRGSALILTVVLTSLLAIVAVLFLMAARVDKMASSASMENRELTFGVDSVVSQIKQVLAADVPGTAGNPEYYDYPDPCDPWLADLEPNQVRDKADKNAYSWRQISDLTGDLAARDVKIKPSSARDVIPEYFDAGEGLPADADGDGIADSKWIKLQTVASNKGRPVYAAIRIIDNGGMLNVNTGGRFNPSGAREDVDGHTPLQVNLLAPGISSSDPLLQARGYLAGAAATNLDAYERDVIWKYDWPAGMYTPFDLSDELELRHRLCVDNPNVKTRLEAIWNVIGGAASVTYPYDASGSRGLVDWYGKVDPNASAPDKRHLLTTYNMDRIITPRRFSIGTMPATGPARDPGRMINVNTAARTAGVEAIQAAVAKAFEGLDAAEVGDSLQIALNIVDYIDADPNVTMRTGGGSGSVWMGCEQPCVYISEVVCRTVNVSGNNVSSWAVELYKPYAGDPKPADGEWRLVVNNHTGGQGTITVPIRWSGNGQFHVVLAENAIVPLNNLVDPNTSQPQVVNPIPFYSKYGASIELRRVAKDGTTEEWGGVDRVEVPGGCTQEDGAARRIQRDIRAEKVIFRLWGTPENASARSLGNVTDSFVNNDDLRKLQVHPANRGLVNIGELGMILAWSASNVREKTPEEAVIDLSNPIYANLLNYLTVIDPESHEAAANEMRVKGRININTAPAFVLAQLPWMGYRERDPNDPGKPAEYQALDRAQAVVAYRNVHGAFTSTAGMLQVPQMRDLASDEYNNLYDIGNVAKRGPDLSKDDVTDDLEERDLIFQRISDLTTVRSDVFTAYMLLRIGVNGPQRRAVAILDRSSVTATGGNVRVVALYDVPYAQ